LIEIEMTTSLDNVLNIGTPWLKTNYLVKQAPGKWQLTCEVLKPLGEDETYILHLYHHLRDWVKRDQIKLLDKNCDTRKFIMFLIDIQIQ